jgi:hypothetical protein
MRQIIAAAALALGGLATIAVGVAHADAVQVEGAYATLPACQADGPQVEIAHNDAAFTHWDCRLDDDGLWYVWLSN